MNVRIFSVCCLTALVLASIGVTSEAAIYVDDDAPGGDGTSWTTAFKYLQDALAVADVDDEIRVAQGTYVPDRSSANPGGTGDRESTFQLIGGVAVCGGYAGYGAADPDERDIEVYETILSGDLLGNDIVPATPKHLLAEPTRSDNCYHVVTSMSIMMFETVVLDGLTITAGHANDIEHPKHFGGGMYNDRATPTIIGCTFRDNCAISSGGGMYTGYSSPTIVGCTFKDNHAEFGGGGLYCRRIDSEIESIISDCAFIGNSAQSGAGFYNDTGDGLPEQNVVNCVFAGNVATDRGGGIFCDESYIDVENCVFTNNIASTEGGAIFNDDSFANVTNCVISGNFAGRNGGGICSSQVRTWLTNCTIVGNEAGEKGGGVFDCISWDRYVTNCILWDNRAYEGPQMAIDYQINLIVRHSCVQGGLLDIYIERDSTVSWADGNNTDADPCFVDPGYWDVGAWVEGDYHLKSQAGRWDPNDGRWAMDEVTSPCIDMGDPNSDWTAELWPHGRQINMGALGGTPEASMSRSAVGNVADLNNSNKVDFADVRLLADKWLKQQPLLPEDLDRNGFVDSEDFAAFGRQWLWEQ